MTTRLLKDVAEIKSAADIFAQFGATANDITKIYYGRDKAGRRDDGRVYERGKRGFENCLARLDLSAANWEIRFFESEGVLSDDGKVKWISLPAGDRLKDMCYCVYFE